MRGPVMLLLAASVGILLAACSGDDEGQRATPQPSATPVPADTAQPEPTPSPATRPAREVTGLFLEPRPTEADAFVSVPPRPPSPFAPWDRESVVVYDLETMTETNYGPGRRPSFSPDGRHMAYNTSGGEIVRIVDLETLEIVDEFEWTGGVASFIDNEFLYLPGPGSPRAYDLGAKEAIPIGEVQDPILRARLEAYSAGLQARLIEGGQYRLVQGMPDDDLASECANDNEVEYNACLSQAGERWTLEDLVSGEVLLQFRAIAVASAAPGELVLATSPQCEDPEGNLRWCNDVLAEIYDRMPTSPADLREVGGTTNIFLIDIETGRAEFIATTTYTAMGFFTSAWALSANEDHVVWMGSYCSPDNRGNTHVMDRTTGEITELDASLYAYMTPSGHIGVDEFGPRALLSPETFEWELVLPEGSIDVVESLDGRYLAVGGVLGHGGSCG